MPGARRIAWAVAAAALTSACSMYKLEALRRATPAGTPFQAALSRLYMDFAIQEEKNYDWRDSWHFADKGLRLAYGRSAEPEALEDWSIPAPVLPDMRRAREALMAALTPERKRDFPSLAADAQFYFDCWVEQQEENWQADDIAYCRDNLSRALTELNATVRKAQEPRAATIPPRKKAAPKARAKTAPAKKADASEAVSFASEELGEVPPNVYIDWPLASRRALRGDTQIPKRFGYTAYALFFEPDTAELPEPGRRIIGEIVASLKKTTGYAVVISPGKGAPEITAQRVEVVKSYLLAGDVPETAIHVKGEGGDATAARQVEIFLNE